MPYSVLQNVSTVLSCHKPDKQHAHVTFEAQRCVRLGTDHFVNDGVHVIHPVFWQ